MELENDAISEGCDIVNALAGLSFLLSVHFGIKVLHMYGE